MKLADLEAYAALQSAAQRGAKCGWLHPVTGDLVVGIARRLGNDSGRVRHDSEVESLALELTTLGGREVSYGLPELVAMVQSLTFVIDYVGPDHD